MTEPAPAPTSSSPLPPQSGTPITLGTVFENTIKGYTADGSAIFSEVEHPVVSIEAVLRAIKADEAHKAQQEAQAHGAILEY